MNYVYVVLLLLIIVFFIVVEFRIAAAAKFTLEDEFVFFIRKQRIIPYGDIVSVERDITFGDARFDNLGYVIFYENKLGVKESFRTFKTKRNAMLWEKFMQKLHEHNPAVLINNAV